MEQQGADKEKQQNPIDLGHIHADDPHEACEKAPPPTKKNGNKSHVFAIPFVCCSSNKCCEHCCEQPFGDSEIAKDIYVVYARWDQAKKQFIPVCMRDHVFEDPYPSFFYASPWEYVWTCFFVALVLTVVLAISSPTSTTTPRGSDHDNHRHNNHYYYSQESGESYDTAMSLAIALVTIGLFVGFIACVVVATTKRRDNYYQQWACCC